MVHASEFKHDCARDEGTNNCESCMPDQNRLMMHAHGSIFSWTFVQDHIVAYSQRNHHEFEDGGLPDALEQLRKPYAGP